MKSKIILLSMLSIGSVLKAQTNDTITKKSIIQFGYVSEYIDGGSAARLNGFEGQIKWLFGKPEFAKGCQPDILSYFNFGYTYFPSSDYSLGQVNVGLGINTQAPVLGKYLRMDISLGAVYYHGTIYDKSWAGKTVDLGGYFGLSVPFGTRGGIYAKYWMPGAITMLSSNDSYIPPTFITAGIEF